MKKYLPIAVFSLGIFIFAVFMVIRFDQLKSDLDIANQTITQMRSDNTQMANSVLILSEEIQLRQDITSLIVDAGRSYNIDPKLLAHVIKSESNFRPNPKHAVPHWVGPGGVNIKAWPHLRNNPHSYTGNIYASAEILSYYLDDSDTTLLALTRYKSLSPQGFAIAKSILKDYQP